MYVRLSLSVCSQTLLQQLFVAVFTICLLPSSSVARVCISYMPPLIDWALRNDLTVLITNAMHARMWHKNICTYIYSLNPWKSNHRDGPAANKNSFSCSIILWILVLLLAVLVLVKWNFWAKVIIWR